MFAHVGAAGAPGPEILAGQIGCLQVAEAFGAPPMPEWAGPWAAADPTGPGCPIAPTLAEWRGSRTHISRD